MKTLHRRWRVWGVVCLAFFTLEAVGQPASAPERQRWFTTYYATWSMMPLGTANYALPPWEMDFRGLTHVVLFDNGNVTQTAPYWAYMFSQRPADTESDSLSVEYNAVAAPGDGVHRTHYMDSLLTIAHRQGVKVVITIQAVNPVNLNFVASDSSRTQLFVNTLTAWASRKGFDGVELDWEGWASPLPSRDVISRFMRILYRSVHAMRTPSGAPGIIMVSAGSGYQDLYDPAQDYCVDQFNLQLYDYAYAWYGAIRAAACWYIAPLHRGTVDPSFEGMSYDTRGPLQWVEAGHDPRRIGLGIPTYGYIMRNVDALFQPMQSNADYGSAHYQVIEALKQNGGTEEWDDARKVRFIHGTAQRTVGAVFYGSDGINAGQKFFATCESIESLREKIRWMEANDFGGIMTYDFVSDLDPTQSIASGLRNPLQRTISRELGLEPPDPPVIVPPPPLPLDSAAFRQTLTLKKGWNVVSSYISPGCMRLDSLFQHLSASGCVIKDRTGAVYWPGIKLHAITAWDPFQAYLLYTEKEDSVSFVGRLLFADEVSLRLAGGMNLVPHLCDRPLPPGEVFGGLKDSLLIVTDGAEEVYWPARQVSTLDSLVPGAGYYVHVSKPVEFVYPSFREDPQDETVPLQPSDSLLIEEPHFHYAFKKNTGVNATVALQASALAAAAGADSAGGGIVPGDEIGAFTPSGLCTGAVKWNGATIALTLWGDNPFTEEIEGAREGEEISYRIWREGAKKEYRAVEVSYASPDSCRFVSNGLFVLKSMKASPIEASAALSEGEQTPHTYALAQNYPNPFNGETTIRFSLAERSRVQLAVYDVLGRVVERLIDNEERASGAYRVVWNAAGRGSGVYFCRLTAGRYTASKRMAFMK